MLKYTVIFLAIVVVQVATLQGENIPVNVRYERLGPDVTSNLGQNRLSLQKSSVAKGNLLVSRTDNLKLIKDLDNKVQLSPEELLKFAKHVPIHHSIHENSNNNELEKLAELHSEPLSRSSSTSSILVIQQAQRIVEDGLKNLRNNFIPKENEIAPSKELWEKLDKDLKKYFLKKQNKLKSEQDQEKRGSQSIFEAMKGDIQYEINKFLERLRPRNETQNASIEDKGTATGQKQGPFQGFIGYFTGGVQNMFNNFPSMGQSGNQTSGNSTGLENSSNGQQPPNFIGNIVNGVQQFFQRPQQGISGNNTQASGNKNVTQTSNPNFIQSIGQNIGSAFQNIQNQFRPGASSTTQKPTTDGADSGTSSKTIIGQVSTRENQLQYVADNNTTPNLFAGSSSEATSKDHSNKLLTKIVPETIEDQGRK